MRWVDEVVKKFGEVEVYVDVDLLPALKCEDS